MKLMDKHIMDEPTAGVLTMQSMLKDQLIHASYERVRRLMRKAHIRAIYPKKHLSILGKKSIFIPICCVILISLEPIRFGKLTLLISQ